MKGHQLQYPVHQQSAPEAPSRLLCFSKHTLPRGTCVARRVLKEHGHNFWNDSLLRTSPPPPRALLEGRGVPPSPPNAPLQLYPKARPQPQYHPPAFPTASDCPPLYSAPQPLCNCSELAPRAPSPSSKPLPPPPPPPQNFACLRDAHRHRWRPAPAHPHPPH